MRSLRNSARYWILTGLAVQGWIVTGLSLRGHERGASSSVITIGEESIRGRFAFSWRDIDDLIPLDANRDGVLAAPEFHAMRHDLAVLGETMFSLEEGGRLLSVMDARAIRERDEDRDIIFEVDFAAAGLGEWASIDFNFDALEDFASGHRHSLQVETAAGDALFEDILQDGDAPRAVAGESDDRGAADVTAPLEKPADRLERHPATPRPGRHFAGSFGLVFGLGFFWLFRQRFL